MKPTILTPDATRWPNFVTPTGKFDSKLYCALTGECRMDPLFMDEVQKLRLAFGRPMLISSGYRSPEYNRQVSDTGATGPHTTGRAIDVLIRGPDAWLLLKAAIELGLTGVGVSQRGTSRFLHLDSLTAADGFPRPNVWSY